MNLREMMSQMQTGMPSGPVQSAADTGIAKAKAPKKKHKNPVAHLAKALSHLKKGEHAQAKTHALSAANAIHKLAKPAVAAPMQPDADPSAVPTP